MERRQGQTRRPDLDDGQRFARLDLADENDRRVLARLDEKHVTLSRPDLRDRLVESVYYSHAPNVHARTTGGRR